MIRIDHCETYNGDGWMLSLRRTLHTKTFDPHRHPLLIIPGYGMNSFIFSFHPRGTSMEASLAERGFEVWSVDLRAQGRSRSVGGDSRYHLEDLVLRDVASAVRCVLDRTETDADVVDLIGCSLGATMMFAHVVCQREPRVGRLVNMGGPVRWVNIHPLLSIAFTSPRLVGMLPIRGARQLAKVALPALQRVPKLLSIYLHPESVDMSQATQLTRTVENPNRHVNRDIAEWIKHGDPIIRGRNVAEGLKNIRLPLLTMIANADGIVPRDTTIWPHDNIGSSRKDVIEVGTPSLPIAHADMFVSDQAAEVVFKPLGDWLTEE
jgi:pimeloyl-ACP methyl ester carboxylesterase